MQALLDKWEFVELSEARERPVDESPSQEPFDAAADFLAKELAGQLAELKKLSPSRLQEQRYAKFREIGHYVESVSEPAETETVPGEEA